MHPAQRGFATGQSGRSRVRRTGPLTDRDLPQKQEFHRRHGPCDRTCQRAARSTRRIQRALPSGRSKPGVHHGSPQPDESRERKCGLLRNRNLGKKSAEGSAETRGGHSHLRFFRPELLLHPQGCFHSRNSRLLPLHQQQHHIRYTDQGISFKPCACGLRYVL